MDSDFAYIITNGVVYVTNSFDSWTDVENPLEDNIYFNFIDVRSDGGLQYYQEIIKNKDYFYFAISLDSKGNYFLDKRTNANAFVLYRKKNDSSIYFDFKSDKDLFKVLKVESKEVVKNLNHYMKGNVFNYILYDFHGEVIDSYFGIYGTDFKKTIEILFDSKIYKEYSLTINYENVCNRIRLNDKLVLKYINDNFKVKDLDELIDVDFGSFSEIFMKDDILFEFWDFVSKNKDTIKTTCKIFNNMVLFILGEQLKMFSL